MRGVYKRMYFVLFFQRPIESGGGSGGGGGGVGFGRVRIFLT